MSGTNLRNVPSGHRSHAQRLGSSDHIGPAGQSPARSLSKAIVDHMSKFVGVEQSHQQAIRWENRRKRYAQTMGALKPQFADLQFVDSSGASHSRTAMVRPGDRKASVVNMTLHGLSGAVRPKPSKGAVAVPAGPMHPMPRPKIQLQGQSISATAFEGDRRVVGVGVMGRFFGRRLHRAAITKDVKAQLDDLDDHRPYFTYWVTFVHIVVFVLACSVYGLAPFGLGKYTDRKTVRLSSLAREVKEYSEQKNLWIGPHQDILSTWKKWTADNTGPGGRLSGSVCGQDPSYCITPASADPFQWPDSIVDWPLCTKTGKQNSTVGGSIDRHMSCEILGRPCCFGIFGECWITTREHCNLLRGMFHEDKFLCSQTSCFEQICGMFPFGNKEIPDQVYRLWTSLFLHAGLVHLLVSIIFQMWIMRDIEKLTGALRLSIIYLASGIAGNLAGSTFIPYIVDTGPSGAQFGVMACLLVEVIQCYQMYRSPSVALLKMFGLFVVLFLFGLLPWFDNWAHLFGFAVGFLLAFALIPYVSFGMFDRRRKIMTILVCLGIAIGMFIVLFLSFYVAPITECKFCKYVNCIPFIDDFCKNMDVSMENRSRYDSPA